MGIGKKLYTIGIINKQSINIDNILSDATSPNSESSLLFVVIKREYEKKQLSCYPQMTFL